ncbi:hypothetical protein BLNAU_18062 [Blattamonas nauphoetae]|uniref:Major facilitator superfamily (MFS) profile domain-containing protein n=1 Tax=Blattamonas nauphoetae TaxID=2049346 RepID=A0ABQ9X9N2_9EUKA|nr:hypothetical protein BLNAU_18062 [Blattamonas nauphoetae]
MARSMKEEGTAATQLLIGSINAGDDPSLDLTIPPPSKEINPKIKTVIIAISFTCIFVAANTSLNYMTTFFPEYSAIVLCLYGFLCAIISIFAPVFTMLFSTYILLIFSAICFLIFQGIALFVLILVRNATSTPTVGVVLLFVAGILFGIGYGLIWSAWTEYMNEISTDEIRGTLSGLFYAIYYMSTPVGNGLTSILFFCKFEKWQVVLVLTAFCAVGVIVMFFVPSGQCTKKPKRDTNFATLDPAPSKAVHIKSYFKSLFGWAKTTATFPVIIIGALYQAIQAFIQACFTQQIPKSQGSTYIGIAFAISGIFSVAASLVFGQVIDRRSKRAGYFLDMSCMLLMIVLAQITILIPQETHGTLRLVFFIITVSVYGFEQTGWDVNNFSLVVALSKGNMVSFFQFTRVFTYSMYGVVSLLSDYISKQPSVLIIVMICLLYLSTLTLWNVDVHKVSFSGFVKPAAIEGVAKDELGTGKHISEEDHEPTERDSLLTDSGTPRHSRETLDERKKGGKKGRVSKYSKQEDTDTSSDSETEGLKGREKSFVDLPEQTVNDLQEKLERSSPSSPEPLPNIDSQPLLAPGRTYKSSSNFKTPRRHKSSRRSSRSSHSSHSPTPSPSPSSSHSASTHSSQARSTKKKDKHKRDRERTGSFFFNRPNILLPGMSSPHPNMPQQPMPVPTEDDIIREQFARRTQSGFFRGAEDAGLAALRISRSQINMKDIARKGDQLGMDDGREKWKQKKVRERQAVVEPDESEEE